MGNLKKLRSMSDFDRPDLEVHSEFYPLTLDIRLFYSYFIT